MNSASPVYGGASSTARASAVRRSRARARWKATLQGQTPTTSGSCSHLPVKPAARTPFAALRAPRRARRRAGARFCFPSATTHPSARASSEPPSRRPRPHPGARPTPPCAATLAGWCPAATRDWHAALPGWRTLALASRRAASRSAPRGRSATCASAGRSVARRTSCGSPRRRWLTRRAALRARGRRRRSHALRAENPPGIGIAWAHAQEVALRAVALALGVPPDARPRRLRCRTPSASGSG